VTNAVQVDCDAQPDTCAPLPTEVSAPGDPVPLTFGRTGSDLVMTFSESAGATQYHLYAGTLDALRQGFYDHGAVAGLCGFTDAGPGDGRSWPRSPGSHPRWLLRAGGGPQRRRRIEVRLRRDGEPHPAGALRLSLREFTMRSTTRVLSVLVTFAAVASAARAQVVLQPRTAPPGRGRPAVTWKRLSPTVSALARAPASPWPTTP
jgi:hypothetical protein